jgi:RNA polymerase sigma-70 factor (ECF subfamily)
MGPAGLDTRALVESARLGSLPAFSELVRRHQGMAVAYALALLRDRDLANDAAQEAFVAAYLGLAQLQEPRAFPGWLRAIVRTHCGRIARRRPLGDVPLDEATGLLDQTAAPDERLERQETRAHLLAALAGLPRPHREVLTLFYVEAHSQREIAGALGLPVTTVNARLHAARVALRDRILGMVRAALESGALPEDFPERIARSIDGWRPGPGPERFDLFRPPVPPPATSAGPTWPDFRPHPDPARCPCLTLAWPCARCAALENVAPAPPLEATW